ncbi:MAG: DUF2069 domain-containing protein [Gammaproteobacteria bacterium]
MPSSSTALRYWHYAALAGFFGLFLLLMAWPTLLVPPTKFPVALVLIFSVTPLLLPMRGFLNGRPKSTAWMAYVSLIYFVHGAVETAANPAVRLYSAAEILFSLLLFFGAVFYVRLTGRH